MNRRVSEFCERFLKDFESDFSKKLFRMDSYAWKQILGDFEKLHDGIGNIFARFGEHLDTKTAEDLIHVRNALFCIKGTVRDVPKAFDTPLESISEEPLLKVRVLTVKLFRELVSSVLKLSQTIKKWK